MYTLLALSPGLSQLFTITHKKLGGPGDEAGYTIQDFISILVSQTIYSLYYLY